jgi:prepilin-type N-terminal cleavage/methylation domain-containing protein
MQNAECRRKRPIHDSKFGVRNLIVKTYSPLDDCRKQRKHSLGFTLLEVLVALSLLGIALVVVMQLFSLDLKSIAHSEKMVEGALIAQSKMREVLSEEEVSERTWRGLTESGYPFEVTMLKSIPERTEELQVRLFDIIVTVYWNQGTKTKSFTLRAQKTVQKQI